MKESWPLILINKFFSRVKHKRKDCLRWQTQKETWTRINISLTWRTFHTLTGSRDCNTWPLFSPFKMNYENKTKIAWNKCKQERYEKDGDSRIVIDTFRDNSVEHSGDYTHPVPWYLLLPFFRTPSPVFSCRKYLTFNAP